MMLIWHIYLSFEKVRVCIPPTPRPGVMFAFLLKPIGKIVNLDFAKFEDQTCFWEFSWEKGVLLALSG